MVGTAVNRHPHIDEGEYWDASPATANHPTFGITKQLLCQLSYAVVIQRVAHGDKRRPAWGSSVIFPEPIAADERISGGAKADALPQRA